MKWIVKLLKPGRSSCDSATLRKLMKHIYDSFSSFFGKFAYGLMANVSSKIELGDFAFVKTGERRKMIYHRASIARAYPVRGSETVSERKTRTSLK